MNERMTTPPGDSHRGETRAERLERIRREIQQDPEGYTRGKLALTARRLTRVIRQGVTRG
jgi:hypothetical protein